MAARGPQDTLSIDDRDTLQRHVPVTFNMEVPPPPRVCNRYTRFVCGEFRAREASIFCDFWKIIFCDFTAFCSFWGEHFLWFLKNYLLRFHSILLILRRAFSVITAFCSFWGEHFLWKIIFCDFTAFCSFWGEHLSVILLILRRANYLLRFHSILLILRRAFSVIFAFCSKNNYFCDFTAFFSFWLKQTFRCA